MIPGNLIKPSPSAARCGPYFLRPALRFVLLFLADFFFAPPLAAFLGAAFADLALFLAGFALFAGLALFLAAAFFLGAAFVAAAFLATGAAFRGEPALAPPDDIARAPPEARPTGSLS